MTGSVFFQVSAQPLVAVLLTLIAIRLRGKLDADYMVVVVPSIVVFSVTGPLVVRGLAVLSESAALAAFCVYTSLLFLVPGVLLPGVLLNSGWAIPCLAIGFSFVPILLVSALS